MGKSGSEGGVMRWEVRKRMDRHIYGHIYIGTPTRPPNPALPGDTPVKSRGSTLIPKAHPSKDTPIP